MSIGIKGWICLSSLLLVRGPCIPVRLAHILSSGLNYRLQKAGSTVTVVAFIIMPASTHSYTVEALKGQAVTKQLRDTVTEIQNRVGARLFDHAARFHGSVLNIFFFAWPDISSVTRRRFPHPTNCFLKKIKCY